jgi:hypothetical protein
MKISLRVVAVATVLAVLAPAAFAFPTLPIPDPIGGLRTANAFPTLPIPDPIGGLRTANAFPTLPIPNPIG